MIRDRIARKTQQKQTFLLIEAVIQVLFPFINVLGTAKSVGLCIVVLFITFLLFWYQFFVRSIFSFIP